MNIKFFAHKYEKSGRFHDIFPLPDLVRMCGNEPIYEIEVRPVVDGEESPYWGWHDFERNEYAMIWPSRVQAEMCFAYGYEIEEKHGRGKFLNFMVTEKGAIQ